LHVNSDQLAAGRIPKSSTEPVGSILEQTAASSRNAYAWAKHNPVAALFLLTIGATLVSFFCFVKLYAGEPIMVFAWKHWLPNLNQEYCKLVIPIAILVAWYHRKELRAASKDGSNWGLTFLVAGFLLVLLGTRAIEPRITMLAIPFLTFGIILFLWGRQVAWILAFPIGFLVFMIPVGALQQTSFRLQFVITEAINALSPLVGIKLNTVGTTLSPIDKSWGFDIAEGCSGIRSLVAIIMLTTVYTHIFERAWWKKLVLLALSIGFAIFANIGRIFTIILVARLGYPKLAGGIYHEYSGFISFPVALCAMLVCHKLLNLGSGRSLLAAESSQGIKK
jgi:exosortase